MVVISLSWTNLKKSCLLIQTPQFWTSRNSLSCHVTNAKNVLPFQFCKIWLRPIVWKMTLCEHINIFAIFGSIFENRVFPLLVFFKFTISNCALSRLMEAGLVRMCFSFLSLRFFSLRRKTKVILVISMWVCFLWLQLNSIQVIPSKLCEKLFTLGLTLTLCNRVLDFLIARPRSVQISNMDCKHVDPQVCVLSPKL